MQFKALVSFSGIISMQENEVREINNKGLYQDLIKAGYVEEIKAESRIKVTRKKVNADEN